MNVSPQQHIAQNSGEGVEAFREVLETTETPFCKLWRGWRAISHSGMSRKSMSKATFGLCRLTVDYRPWYYCT